MKNKNQLLLYFPAAWMNAVYFILIEFLMRKIYAVCKFFNKKSVQIVEANSHISG